MEGFSRMRLRSRPLCATQGHDWSKRFRIGCRIGGAIGCPIGSDVGRAVSAAGAAGAALTMTLVAALVMAASLSSSVWANKGKSSGADEIAQLKARVAQLEEQLIDMRVIVGTVQTLAKGQTNAAAGGYDARGYGGGAGGDDPRRLQGLETQMRALTAQVERLSDQVRQSNSGQNRYVPRSSQYPGNPPAAYRPPAWQQQQRDPAGSGWSQRALQPQNYSGGRNGADGAILHPLVCISRPCQMSFENAGPASRGSGGGSPAL